MAGVVLPHGVALPAGQEGVQAGERQRQAQTCGRMNGLANTHSRNRAAVREAGPDPRSEGLRMGKGQGNGSTGAGVVCGTAGACQAGGKESERQ